MSEFFGVGLLRGHRVGNSMFLKLLMDKLYKQHNASNKFTSLAVSSLGEIAVYEAAVSPREFITSSEYLKMINDRFDATINDNKAPYFGIASAGINESHLVATEDIVGTGSCFMEDYKAVDAAYGSLTDGDERDISLLLNIIPHLRREATTFSMDSIGDLQTTFANTTEFVTASFVLTGLPHQLYLFRGTRELSLHMYPKQGIFIFGNDSFALAEASKTYLGPSEEFIVKQYSGVCIDAYNNTITKFDLPNENENWAKDKVDTTGSIYDLPDFLQQHVAGLEH